MNKKKALQQAREWIENKPPPKELDYGAVEKVLESLGFEFIRKHSSHTTFRWKHESLTESDFFIDGILKISVSHKKRGKSVLRVGSISKIRRALSIKIEE